MFCVVKGRERDGLGKLVSTGAECTVEYFDSPADDGIVRCQIPKSAILPKRLGRNVRVYVYRELENAWRVGRVQEDDGSGLYVRFSHKDDQYVDYADAFVRWKRAIQNPAEFLARFVTETPQYAEARSTFLQSYTQQRGAASGIKALLSSSVELNPHQIDVARRVLNDPSQRYLLADEVGLGKTIEAGVVIRQAVLDDLDHRVVILVPAPLVRQWRQELVTRFGLDVFIDESVFVLPHHVSDDLLTALNGATLLVVDEAHHVAAPSDDEAKVSALYETLRQAARRTDSVLLLSATPILRNEVGFLRMLHLLDPIAYPLEDYAGFRHKIEQRQTLAEVVAMLSPENALFLDDPLDGLAARFPNDERLQGLVHVLKEKLLEMPDEDDEDLIAKIRQLKAHVSETYRLNRRILRNRRKQVTGLTPNRKGARCWLASDSPLSHVEALLEEWRIAASAAYGVDTTEPTVQALARFYWSLATAYLENPAALPRLCARRRALPAWPLGEAFGRFEQEDALLARLITLCDDERWLDARCDRLIDGLRSLPATTKAVVFCSSMEVADDVSTRLQSAGVRAVRHQTELDDDDLDTAESWTTFMTDPNIGVLVCDQHAEEGLNLQGRDKTLVHFDLPVAPNRIEQRMGRVDRYGAGNQIPSYALLDEGTPLQHAWYVVLQEGWRVFDQSISSLQYLVEDEVGRLQERLFIDGVEALQDLGTRLAGPRGLVATELKLIDQQDALDELSPLPESATDDLFDVDSAWRTIRRAMLYWISDTLLFSAVPVPDAALVVNIDPPVRFHYHPPESASQATLMPLTGFLGDFLGAVDYAAPGSRASEPRSYPHAARRETAVTRKVRPLRYGDEFVDAIKAFSDIDDRGRSFAMWRQVHAGLPAGQSKLCFRFDFLVETRLTQAEAVLAAALDDQGDAKRSVLARRGDALLAPFMVQIWLDEDGDELPPDLVERLLAPGYEKAGSEDYIDKNLGREHLRALKRFAPDAFSNWQQRCLRMHERAQALVLARPELAARKHAALMHARAEDEVRLAQRRSRIQSLTGAEARAEIEQLELEQRLNDALYEGIAHPELKTDVAGFVYLTDRTVAELDPLMGSSA